MIAQVKARYENGVLTPLEPLYLVDRILAAKASNPKADTSALEAEVG